MSDQANGQSNSNANQSDKFKIKVAGEEKEVTKDELIRLAQQGEDYTKKTQALAEQQKALKAEEERVKALKVVVDEMEQDPKLKETLNKVYSDYKSGKISTSDANKDRNLKRLDKLIEEARDAEQKEQLRDIRQIIIEETDKDSFQNEIKSLKDEINFLKRSSTVTQEKFVEDQISEISSRFGKDLVEKYKEDIKSSKLKYPNQSIEKLFYHFATDEDIRSAVINEEKRKKEEEIKQKSRGSVPGYSSSPTPVEVPRDRAGRVDFKSLIGKMKSAGKFS